MSARLTVPGNPVANADSVVAGKHWRITVLTPGLVRLEWSDDGTFEDRASTFAVNRALPAPRVEVHRDGERVELTTA